MRPGIVCALATVVACSGSPGEPREAVIDAECAGSGGPRVLVFSRETLWMHPSTPVARDALVAMCATEGFSVTASSDPAVFDSIDAFDVAVFAVTSGNVLDAPGRAAFEAWVRAGGGVVGVHSASATEYDWPFFVELIGARFRTHPPALIAGDVTIEAASPIVTGLPAPWRRTDEWYSFHEAPAAIDATVHVILALDEATTADLPADQRTGFHPVAWTDDHLGGRMFYTSMGHTPESYAEPDFLLLLAQAITWAAGR